MARRKKEDWLKCGVCKKKKADVRSRPDPFMQEIHEEKIIRNYCDDCFLDRSYEV